MNYSPRVSLRSLWAHETYVGVQSALLWKSRPQWCENVLQCIQKKTRMGSLPFTIHNISHHNKKRSPRSFEKRSEGKYLCTPSYRGLLVTAVLLFGRSTAVSQSIWLKKKKGLSSRKLIHTKYVEYTHIKEVVVHVMAICNVQVLRHRVCYRWFIKKRTWVPLSRAGIERCSSSRECD